MSRYRLYPSPEQEAVLREHCSHARYIWNLAWNLHHFGTLETYGEGEKVSTGLARRFDLIRFEDLRIKNMTRSGKGTVSNPGSNVKAKSALNRAILAQGWGLLVRRTQDKAPGRVEKVRAAYTSLRCSACGWIDKNSRDSQAGFCCVACGFTCNADINASINIAAGHAGGTPVGVREPQLVAS